ncbi:tRNA pseudouridine(38-40) synthase TruA [Sporolactobacillus shoreicorticis]|uniref:tRNA pseudouridine synthase A n=1 Tax=Sporolactobacillus shoreicorticis TaxID=1923877 RepID=A0ABW5S6X7_9BACL|nr:tRNA pseudouridine(38-40) synthase TruA [Sporolactobacillus shoreicorticis]MCO7125517.1 tRNA pseudouridine(38-40) synthase TruA [Sporolactobacillus shoreicorticis]
MNNYKLTIQYDGGRYKGWQRLGNDKNTIQGKIEAALTVLDGDPVEIVGCSRTDAGVHALGQVANFKTKKLLTEEGIYHHLNHHLPQDISVIDVARVPERFHARYNAKEKSYLYKIWNGPISNPFMRKYSMHVDEKLDVGLMKQASHDFIGTHDFTAYANAKSKKKPAVRTISAIIIDAHDDFIDIRLTGDGFLYNMARKMVGTLIEAGLGVIDASAILQILESKKRVRTGRMAEACGLYLEKVKY